MTPLVVFTQCVQAIRQGSLIERVSKKDKEYHLQDWFKDRLEEIGVNFEVGGRNKYPDFRMVATTEGYELKGLAYPGRDVNFDSNSQVPAGHHNGRTIYYVFGRYPKEPDGDTYPVIDLVICHGDFLNADHEYIHQNKHIKGFGSYGDIMIRDRKMYVVPTPFHLVEGVAHQQTLILPDSMAASDAFVEIGSLRGGRADRRLFLRLANQRIASQEGAEFRRWPGALLSGLAAQRIACRAGFHARHRTGGAGARRRREFSGRLTCI
jgi:hypothetical protein